MRRGRALVIAGAIPSIPAAQSPASAAVAAVSEAHKPIAVSEVAPPSADPVSAADVSASVGAAVAADVSVDADLVVAADGGLDVAVGLGWRVDAVVGDLDSAGDGALAEARRLGVDVVDHPERKDSTDLELALEYACRRACEVHVLASAGGRLDHALAGLLVLASPRWATVALSATVDEARVQVLRGSHRLVGDVGEVVSLLAVGGPARVVRTWGLEYPLSDEVLDPTAARGVSNVIVASPAGVEVAEGVLLAVIPASCSQ